MKTFSLYKLLLLAFCFACVSPGHADTLGRIFTSAEERQKLEKIRHKKEAVEEIVVKEPVKAEEPVVEKEIVNRETIRLKGLVHREGGKSTAWINETNTFEGDLDSQFIQVPDSNIKADNVTIIMPDDDTNVELRVGEAFIPAPIERDLLDIEGGM